MSDNCKAWLAELTASVDGQYITYQDVADVAAYFAALNSNQVQELTNGFNNIKLNNPHERVWYYCVYDECWKIAYYDMEMTREFHDENPEFVKKLVDLNKNADPK